MLLLLILSQYAIAETAERSIEVQLKLGNIMGKEEEFMGQRVQSFLSVPFAEKPIGEDRFKPPKVKKPWNGTIETKKLSVACYQGRDTYNQSFWGSEMWNANTDISEDCLYLNIWAPAEAYNLTVMVWLFGGGFWYGSPSLGLYDGRALALTGNVVVVNVNYRIGPFGFLYYGNDDIPGNMGMLDQQVALYWIKDNIFHFGGNPSRMTLFGESAGASSIVAHMIAPGSRDLFNNGILQSGALDNKWAMDTPKRAKDKSLLLASLVGCNHTQLSSVVACMRNIPAQSLVDNIWNVGINFMEFPFVIVSKDKNFFKHKDGFVALREGDFRDDVNIMIGINHDEGNFWNIYNLKEYFDKESQPQLTKTQFHDSIERAFAVQPSLVRNAAKFVYSDTNCSDGSGEGERATKFYAEQVNQMVGDYFFTCDSIWMADKIAEKRNGKANGKVYIYYFDQPSSANPWPAWTGVMHGYEIEFVFGAPLHNETAGYTSREKIFSTKVIEYWSSFSTTGVPTLRDGKSKEYWPPYDGKTARVWMYLRGGSHLKPMNATKRVECDLWRHAKDLEYQAYLYSQVTSSSSFLPMVTSIVYIMLARIILSY